VNTGESKERSTHGVAITVALISALATIAAALIAAILPNLRPQGGEKPEPAPKVDALPAAFVAKMGDCVGKWRWRTSDRSIEFDLRGGSFTAENFPDDGGLQDIADGKGNWEVVNGRLTVTMTHVGKLGLWKAHKVEWISDELITAVAWDEITLKGSKPLLRK
jgi:hypothetical protein